MNREYAIYGDQFDLPGFAKKNRLPLQAAEKMFEKIILNCEDHSLKNKKPLAFFKKGERVVMGKYREFFRDDFRTVPSKGQFAKREKIKTDWGLLISPGRVGGQNIFGLPYYFSYKKRLWVQGPEKIIRRKRAATETHGYIIKEWDDVLVCVNGDPVCFYEASGPSLVLKKITARRGGCGYVTMVETLVSATNEWTENKKISLLKKESREKLKLLGFNKITI